MGHLGVFHTELEARKRRAATLLLPRGQTKPAANASPASGWRRCNRNQRRQTNDRVECPARAKLDAAQFAIDRFLNAKQNVSEQMSEIYQSIRDGSVTDEDRKRLKTLREQYIALSKEVEDVMGRLLIGKHLHHS
jgi:hypothetical protein